MKNEYRSTFRNKNIIRHLVSHDLLLPGDAEGQRAVEGGFLDDLDGVLRQEADLFEVLEQLRVAVGDVVDDDGLAGLGLVAGTFGGSENGQFLTDIDISTVEGAEAAILALDNAIATVSSQRADLGAIQNRLEFTLSNLGSVAENVTAARSRVRDADFAMETANLTRSQILQQAGVAMLAQANTAPQSVLALLQ